MTGAVDFPADVANLSFVLCGLIMLLGSLLIWAIHLVDRWMEAKRPVTIRRIWRE